MTQNPGYTAKVKKLAKQKAANKNTFAEEEHMRNLAALRQRVQNVGNVQDRAKNKFDPLTHPVRFFRKSQTEAEKVSLGNYQKRVEVKLAEVKKKNDELAQQWIQSSMEAGGKKKNLSQKGAMASMRGASYGGPDQ